MPLDPSIILGYKAPQFPGAADVAQMKALQYRNALAGIQLQQAQRKIQQQNALREAMSAPGAIDPTTGMPSSQTVGNVMRVDPMAGIGLVRDAAKIDEERQKAQNDQIRGHLDSLGIAQKQHQLLQSQAMNLQARYDGYIKSGATPQQAASLVTRDKLAWLDNAEQSGMISPQQARAFRTPFDPRANQAFIAYNPQYQAAQKTKTETKKPMSSVGKLNSDLAAGRITKDQYTQAIMSATGGLDPSSIDQTADLIAHYKMAPLSAWAMSRPIGAQIMSKVRELNPQYDAKLWVGGEKAIGAFSSGPQANTVRSFSVAINHLDTLGDLADALGNGNVQMINKIANRVSQEFGGAAPTNFNAVKKLVADEIVKAIVGSGGGVTDRQEAADAVNAAQSPAQLKGVIESYEKLMAGQLDGFQRQYQQSTGRKDFDKFLSPQAQKMLKTVQGQHATSKSAPEAAIQYLKSHPDLKSAFQAKYGYVPDGM